MKKLFQTIAISFCILSPYITTSQIITTVAGDGSGAFGGDGMPATSAQLHQPKGIAYDVLGNMYIADTYNNRIRKIDATGTITTVAGTGIAGAAGDEGPATAAQLNMPYAIAFDHSGNMYIADYMNTIVRKISTDGIIHHFAGAGGIGYTGDNGPATVALIGYISGVAVDASDNVYITSPGSNTVRKINTAGIITTVAGNGTSGFSGDGGPATAAKLNTPHSITFDHSGNMYIADQYNCRVRKVNTAGIISTIAGTGTCGSDGDSGMATLAQITNPTGVAVDAADNLYIACYNEQVVHKVTSTGIITTVAGTNYGYGYNGDGGLADTTQLNHPYGVTIGPDGNLYIADELNNRIRKVTAQPCSDVHAGGISSFAGDTICNGSTTLLTTNALNSGSGFIYMWQVSTDGATWFYASSTAPGYFTDVLTAVHYYRFIAICPTAGYGDTSTAITITPVTNVVPAVTISVSPDTIINPGISDTFTATVINGGTSPTYQWIKNNVPVTGAITNTFITNSLTNNDTIACIIHSSVQCAIPDTAISNRIVMHAAPNAVSSVQAIPGVTVYPNPNSGTIHIEGYCTDDVVYVEVYNSIGIPVVGKKMETINGTVKELLSLPAGCSNGLYTIILRSVQGSSATMISVVR